jgi:hypothetical protein
VPRRRGSERRRSREAQKITDARQRERGRCRGAVNPGSRDRALRPRAAGRSPWRRRPRRADGQAPSCEGRSGQGPRWHSRPGASRLGGRYERGARSTDEPLARAGRRGRGRRSRSGLRLRLRCRSSRRCVGRLGRGIWDGRARRCRRRHRLRLGSGAAATSCLCRRRHNHGRQQAEHHQLANSGENRGGRRKGPP